VGERAFAELNPACRQAPGCAIRLEFDCPVCGPPYRIDIPVVLNGEGAQLQPEVPKWTATTPDISWDRLTVTPSIDNTPGGHGRKKPCPFHGSIVDGQVMFP
jgi:hypothetical protein